MKIRKKIVHINFDWKHRWVTMEERCLI